jgi:hypothetical protein
MPSGRATRKVGGRLSDGRTSAKSTMPSKGEVRAMDAYFFGQHKAVPAAFEE